MKIIKLGIIIFFIIGILIIFDEKYYIEKNISFGEIEGKIFLPKSDFNKKCFVFIHGDGPMSIDGMGFYKTYFNEFAKKGYCSFSWDKPQNYKTQTMGDRALEVENAISELHKYVKVEKIYVIGWSQSAWVMGYLDQEKIDAIIQIGGAVDWISQGKYMTKTRAELEKWSEEKLQNVMKSDEIFNQYLLSGISYQEYLDTDDFEEVGEENWNFWQKNISEDIRNNYENISVPYLAIFGGNDAHVDVEFSGEIYEDFFKKNNSKYTELFYENGNHIIIKSSKKHFINEENDGIINFIKNEFLGIYAYPKNYFQDILEGIEKEV